MNWKRGRYKLRRTLHEGWMAVLAGPVIAGLAAHSWWGAVAAVAAEAVAGFALVYYYARQ